MEKISFELLRIEFQQDGWFIVDTNRQETQKVYSQKSVIREGRLLNELLSQNLQKNQRTIWIAPYLSEIESLVQEHLKNHLIWLSPCDHRTGNTEKIPAFPVNVINSQESLDFFLREVSRNDKFSIQVHPSLRDYHFDELLKDLLKESAVRIKTIDHFKRIWIQNFRKNRINWKEQSDISQMKVARPGAMVLGGPGVDLHIERIRSSGNLWCADTALPALLSHGILPRVVFSLDAGFATCEHFISAIDRGITGSLVLVMDPFSHQLLYKTVFLKKYSYANTNPLIQAESHSFSVLNNDTGDVFGLMIAVFRHLFGGADPEIYGHDGGHVQHVTHLRGSAYHLRQYQRCNRIITPETYFYHLSDRYSRN